MTKTPNAQAPSPDEAAASEDATAGGAQDTAANGTANSDTSSTAPAPGDAAAGSPGTSVDKPDAVRRRAVTAGTAPAIDRSRRPPAWRGRLDAGRRGRGSVIGRSAPVS